MTQIIVAGIASFIVAIFATPLLIRYFSKRGVGQEIREEGPASHHSKAGTPTMGGIAILVAIWAGYLGAQIFSAINVGSAFTASGLLVLGLATILGIVGALDDGIKLRRARNLGLSKKAKLIGQLAAGLLFGVMALKFPSARGDVTPASRQLSYVRDLDSVSLPIILFLAFVIVVVWSWSNAVNLTDGLDGLAGGSMAMLMGTYVIITFWQFRYSCYADGDVSSLAGCYTVRDPLDLAVVCASAMGACVGFLWWNAAPARIFMGDTGSLMLGGLVAGVSILSHTELLMIVAGALFVIEVASVAIQIAVFQTTGHRPFRMAPLHHHFELGGWKETTVIIRFWLLSAISVALALAMFYGEWLSQPGT